MKQGLLASSSVPLQVSLDQLMLAAPVALIAANREGRILFSNPKLDALFGYVEGELLDKEIECLLPDSLRILHIQHRHEYAESPRPRTMGSGMDLVGMRKDGSCFPIEVGLSHLQIDDQLIVMGSVIDITVRKRTEEILEERVVERTRELERRRRISEGLVTVLSMINANQHLDEILNAVLDHATTVLNVDACAIMRNLPSGGCEVQVAKNLPETYITLPRLAEGSLKDKQQLAKNVEKTPPEKQHKFSAQGLPNKEITQIFDLQLEPPTGLTAIDDCHRMLIDMGLRAKLAIPLIVRNEVYGSFQLYLQRPHRFLADELSHAQILSEQIALALENARLHADLKFAAVKAERNRIAHDLHDSVTQTLFSASMIADILPTLWQRRPKDAARRLTELRELTRGALAEMRTLLLELRPEALENIELPELLNQLATAFVGRSRLPLALSIDGQCRVEYSERIALYRIAQEALNNVSKHAEANQASLLLAHQNDRIELSIEDNGNGFDPSAARGNHLVLKIMRERAAEIGAVLEIKSQPGQGTKVTVLWSASN